jgi:Leucine-rich repeat (LRR) protein
LRANQLTELPSTISRLQNLEKLDLRWNKALIVPKWIAKLERQGCLIYF